MEDFLGPLVIVVLAVVSLVGQALEGRKKKQQDAERKDQRKSMPPEMRRQLFGDKDDYEIPMAKPKQGGQQGVPLPPPPPPRRQVAQQQPAPQPEQRRQVASQKREAPPSTPRPKVAPKAQHPPKRRTVREFIPPEARRRVQETLEEIMRQAQGADQPEVSRETKPAGTPQRRQKNRRTQQAHPEGKSASESPTRIQRKPFQRTAETVMRAKPRASHPLMKGLINSPQDLRRGIVLREILGPPKGL